MKTIGILAGRNVLSMIEVTLAEVQHRRWRRVGVLGFADPRVMVYAQPMSQLLLQANADEPDLINPAQLLAASAIWYALI